MSKATIYTTAGQAILEGVERADIAKKLDTLDQASIANHLMHNHDNVSHCLGSYTLLSISNIILSSLVLAVSTRQVS